MATLSPALLVFSTCFVPHAMHAKSVHPDFKLLRGEVQHHGDWLVGCDNEAHCAMLGFPPQILTRELDPFVVEMALQISLPGANGTAPDVEMLAVPQASNAGVRAEASTPFVLNVEYDSAAIFPPHGFSRTRLDPVEAAAVIKHLSGGKVLLGKALSNGSVRARFPSADFVRAYRAMQSRHLQLLGQIKAQAVGDVPGELPDGSAMPSPAPLGRLRALPAMVSGFVAIVTENSCGSSRSQNVKRYQFPGDTDLWSYECAGGAAAGKTYLAMSRGSNNRAVPVELPEPRLGKIAAGHKGLTTAGLFFDWDFGILRHYDFQVGREDCGTFRAWGYTINGWHLLERREMPLCKGLDASQWIRTYYAPINGAGPDE